MSAGDSACCQTRVHVFLAGVQATELPHDESHCHRRPGRLIGILPPETTMYGPAVDTRLDRYWWGYVPVLLGPQDDAEKMLRRESRRAHLRGFPASGINGIALDSNEYAELLPITEQLTQIHDSASGSEGGE
jgi:hypothetical protein